MGVAMVRRLLVGLLILACTDIRLWAGGTGPAPGQPLKVAMLLTDHPDDFTWNFRHNQGRLNMIERMLQSDKDLTIESELYVQHHDAWAPEADETYAKVLKKLMQWGDEGYHLVLSTSFDFWQPTVAVANMSKYAATNWVHISGPPVDLAPPNYAVSWTRIYQARYLTGIVAGAASKQHKIGYVASFPFIPEVVRGVNAFTIGARETCPTCEVYTTWLFAWYFSAKTERAVNWLLHFGCDVFANHCDDSEVYEIPTSQGIPAIGYHNDMRSRYGDLILVSAYFEWANLYIQMVNDTLNGRFTSAPYHFSQTTYGGFDGMETGVPSISRLSQHVTRATRDHVERRRAGLAAGTFDVFCGDGRALHDASGINNPAPNEVKYQAGQCATLDDLQGMTWLVEGVRDLGEVTLMSQNCGHGNRTVWHMDAVPIRDECIKCEPGTFAAAGGMTECMPCSAGNYSGVGASHCIRCPQGEYAAEPGSAACSACASGWSNVGDGNTECLVRDLTLLYVFAGVAGFLLIVVGPIAAWKFTATHRRMRVLYNNNAIAESCAESIAAMRLEEVEYINEIPDPNRIQRAFMSIVYTLTEYRRYLPASVLAGVGGAEQEDFGDEAYGDEGVVTEYGNDTAPLANNDSQQRKVPQGWVSPSGSQGKLNGASPTGDVENPITSPHAVTDSRRSPPRTGTQGALGGSKRSEGADPRKRSSVGTERRQSRASGSAKSDASGGLGMLPRRSTMFGSLAGAAREDRDRQAAEQKRKLAAQLDIGFRERKGALLLAEADLGCVTAHAAFTIGSNFASHVLNAVQQRDGLPLELRADACAATWNSHRPCPRYALHSSLSNVAAVTSLRGLMRDQARGGSRWWSLSCSAGQISVGHVGDARQRAPFVMGRAATQVRCLGALARGVRAHAVATQAVQELCQQRIDFLPIDVVPADAWGADDGDDGALRSAYDISVFEIRGEKVASPAAVSPFHSAYGKAWALLRAPVPNYAHVAKALEEAVSADPEDKQGRRMLRLAALGTATSGALPAPYRREWVGWERYEQACEGAELSDTMAAALQLAEQRRRRSSVSPKALRSGASAGAAAKAELLNPPTASLSMGSAALRDEIEHQQRLRQKPPPRRGSSGSSVSTVSPRDGTNTSAAGEFPSDFVDRDGSRWWRASKKLGAGGYGEVWLGMSEDGGLVALKLLPLPAAQKQQKVSRLRPQQNAGAGGADKIDELLQEVRLMADLQHDNVVQVMSSACIAGMVVVVMEFVPGGSLQTVLDQFGKLPVSSLKRYSRDTLRGLHFLHTKGVVHRDLKPANLLLQIDGMCKLADFGAAAELSAAAQQSTLGTPMYMAPEACRGQAEKASDVWSFSISWFQLAVGVLPWDASVQQQQEKGDGTPDGEAAQGALSGSGEGPGVGGGGVIQFMRKMAKDETMVPNVTPELVPEEDLREFIKLGLHRDHLLRPNVETLLIHQFLQ